MQAPQIFPQAPQTHPKIHEQVPVPADGAGVPHEPPPALREEGEWGQSQSLPLPPKTSQCPTKCHLRGLNGPQNAPSTLPVPLQSLPQALEQQVPQNAPLTP